ncbi:MAG: hypothetical protein IKX35_03650 [Bacteroidales bacterium]|nr:hypothetical protein [Bacteroidales bacterium]
MWRKIRLLLIISGLVIAFNANAQFDDPKTLEVGPHVGLSYYMGDLNPALPFAMADLEYGGLVRFNYNNRWTFRCDYAYATVKADDKIIKWRPERELNFTSKIHDLSFVAEFNFWEYYTGNPKKNVSPYIFGGVSVFYYTVFANVGDTLVDLSDYKTEPLPADPKWYDNAFGKTSPIGVSIPFGVGVKFALSRRMAGTVEWRMQKTFTDYLDDVATVYSEDAASYEDVHIVRNNGAVDTNASYAIIYNLSDPTADPMEVPINANGGIEYPLDDQGNPIKVQKGNYLAGQQRGNSAFNDWFGMARVSLTWKFNLPDGRGCNLSKF